MHAKQKFLIIIIILAVALIVGISIIYYVYNINQDPDTVNANANKKLTNTTTVTTNSSTTNTNSSTTETVAPERTEQEEKTFILNLAKNFTERFGTYSNQNDFANLENSKVYATADMQARLDKIIDDNQKYKYQPYFSIDAEATSATLLEYEFGQDSAKAQVVAIRQETQSLPDKTTNYNQTAEVVLKKQNNTWKIDIITWR